LLTDRAHVGWISITNYWRRLAFAGSILDAIESFGLICTNRQFQIHCACAHLASPRIIRFRINDFLSTAPLLQVSYRVTRPTISRLHRVDPVCKTTHPICGDHHHTFDHWTSMKDERVDEVAADLDRLF